MHCVSFRSPYLNFGFDSCISYSRVRLVAFNANCHLKFNMHVSCDSIIMKGDDERCGNGHHVCVWKSNKEWRPTFAFTCLFFSSFSSASSSSSFTSLLWFVAVWCVHAVHAGSGWSVFGIRHSAFRVRWNVRQKNSYTFAFPWHLYLAPQKCVVTTPRWTIGNMNRISKRQSKCKFQTQ